MTHEKSVTETHLDLETNSSCEKALLCARAALEKKAESVKILDLTELSSLTDAFLICSGMSDRQVKAIADSVQTHLELAGHEVLSVEGYSDGRWILLDCGDVIVHIFLDALREYYDLENLWSDAPRIKIPSEFYLEAKDGKTHLS
ncbi:MAG: ribosome silencing factor [Bdellovibrionia bacterium]